MQFVAERERNSTETTVHTRHIAMSMLIRDNEFGDVNVVVQESLIKYFSRHA